VLHRRGEELFRRLWDGLAQVPRAVRLAGVLNQDRAGVPGHLLQRTQIAWLSVQVHGHDRGGTPRHARCRFLGVHQQGLLVYIRKTNRAACRHNADPGERRGERRRDHLLLRRNHAGLAQAQFNRLGPVGHAHRVARAEIGGPLAFECRQLRPQDELRLLKQLAEMPLPGGFGFQ